MTMDFEWIKVSSWRAVGFLGLSLKDELKYNPIKSLIEEQ
jgi:hypothetical protein